MARYSPPHYQPRALVRPAPFRGWWTVVVYDDQGRSSNQDPWHVPTLTWALSKARRELRKYRKTRNVHAQVFTVE
jgi:hypothetical protein